MLPTTFCDLVGCDRPLQLSGFGGSDDVGLPAAVSNCGALGMLPGSGQGSDGVDTMLDRFSRLSDGPVGVNFIVPFSLPEAMEAAGARARVVELFWAEPTEDLVQRGQSGGAVVGWQVGTVADARAAQEMGCDYVVIQGVEAGGHVAAVKPLADVISETVNALDVPVLAAGGIGTRADAEAAFDAGAAGIRVGTRLLAAEESHAHPEFVDRLIDASADDTEMTIVFGEGWPDAPHRVLRSSIEAVESNDADEVGHVSTPTGEVPVPRFSITWPTTDFSGDVGATALYAGTSVDGISGRQPAAEIVAELLGD